VCLPHAWLLLLLLLLGLKGRAEAEALLEGVRRWRCRMARGGGGGTQAHQAQQKLEGQGECSPGPIELGPIINFV